MPVKTIRTAADIAALSENDKNTVFAFDTARERLKGGVIRSFLLACLVIGGSLFSTSFSPSIEGADWMRSASEWTAYFGFALALVGIPLFCRNLKHDYVTAPTPKDVGFPLQGPRPVR